MHERYFAERTAVALEKITDSAETLVDIFDLDPSLLAGLNPSGNLGADPVKMKNLIRLESTAAILSALVDAVSGALADPEIVSLEIDEPESDPESEIEPEPKKPKKSKVS